MNAPRSMRCPACRFGVTHGTAPPDLAFCTGAGHALAASHDNATGFPFDFCREHAAVAREAMNAALDARAGKR